jgi:hypothetical protein
MITETELTFMDYFSFNFLADYTLTYFEYYSLFY